MKKKGGWGKKQKLGSDAKGTVIGCINAFFFQDKNVFVKIITQGLNANTDYSMH